MAWPSWVALALAVSAATPAAAVTYCCRDEQGRRVCGDTVPVACRTRAYQELRQGVVVREHAPPASAEQRAREEAEAARRKAEEEKLVEQRRRDRALLATYASTADIDAKRERSLATAQAALDVAREELRDARARKKRLDEAVQSWQGRPMPEALQADIRDNAAKLAAREAAVAEREREIREIEARFEEEKRRFIALGGRRAEESAPVKAR